MGRVGRRWRWARVVPTAPSPARPLLALPLLALAALALTGCGSGAAVGDRGAGGAGTGSTADVRIVVTMSVLGDLVADVAGPEVQVTSLVPIGGDPHVHEPRPSDAIAIAEADLVVDHGLGLSPWADPLLQGRGGPVLDLGTALEDRVRRGDDGALDPHLWMVPAVVADAYVPAIADAVAALPALDPIAVAGRAAALQAELRDLHEEVAATLAEIPPARRVLVTSHDAYRYFAAAFGLRVVGTVVGVTTEEEPSAQRIAELVEVVRALSVPAVFVETTTNPRLVQQVAREAGVAVADPLYGDSLGPPGSGADTYAGMLRRNAETIVAALGEAGPTASAAP